MHTNYVADQWNAGRSASEIVAGLASEFNVERSRNAVIGRINAIGLMGTRSQLSRNRAMKRRRVSDLTADALGQVAQFGTPQPLPPDEPMPATAVELEDRQQHQCCWPINHGGPFLYCGAVKAHGQKHFCHHHANRAFRRRKGTHAKTMGG